MVRICGHLAPPETLRQLHVAIAPALHIGAALDRRGGGGQDHGGVFYSSAHHRHVAGVVMNPVLLLVGCLVLLIDDDQAEIAIRQKQGRAGARHHLDVAGCDAGINPLALAAGDAGMPGRRLGAEAGLEPVQELRREGNFRHQDQRLPSLPQCFCDRLEINLGLPRSGHPFQQEDCSGIFTDSLRRGSERRRAGRRKGPSG